MGRFHLFKLLLPLLLVEGAFKPTLSWGESNRSCLKEAVIALEEQGLSRSERRMALLPALDLDSLERRLRPPGADRERNPRLPELRADVAWTRSTLTELENRFMKELVSEKSRKNLKKVVSDLRSRLSALLKDPEGVSLSEWRQASAQYVDFSHATNLEKEQLEHYFLSYDFDSQSKAGSSTTPIESLPGYIRIPTCRVLDVPTLDDWMSRGLTPLWVSDQPGRYDGLKNKVSPKAKYNHDKTHLIYYPLRKTNRSGLDPRTYFLKSREKLAQLADLRLRQTIEGRWHFFYHETRSSFGYGPDRLTGILNDPSLRASTQKDFMKRMRANDIGDHMSGGYPDASTLEQADEWLLNFAREIENDFPPAK